MGTLPKDRNVMKPMVVVKEDIKMLELLNVFQRKKKHIALVANDPEAVEKAWAANEEVPPDVHMSGIITLEDIMEKLLQEDILDEHDEIKAQSTNFRSIPQCHSPARTPGHGIRNLQDSALPQRQKSGANVSFGVAMHFQKNKAQTMGLGKPLLS